MKATVVFVVRSDWSTKHGGDRVQIESYATGLRGRGIDVAIRPFPPSEADLDRRVIHLFNIDQTYELLEVVHRMPARSSLFVTPIHHDHDRVRRMRRCSQPGSRLVALANRLPERWRELLAFLKRTSRIRSCSLLARIGLAGRAALRSFVVRSSVARALDRAEHVFVAAPSEVASISRDFGWRSETTVLTPNGAEAVAHLPCWSTRSSALLCVGRVEPRKQVLELARECAKRNVALDIFGTPGSDESYVATLERLMKSNSLVRWSGARPHAELLEEMLRYRTLVNASFVEVQSLSEAEAFARGMNVVAFDSGYSGHWLRGGYFVVDSWEIADLVDRAIEVNELEPQRHQTPPTWNQAVATLVGAYSSATGRHV